LKLATNHLDNSVVMHLGVRRTDGRSGASIFYGD